MVVLIAALFVPKLGAERLDFILLGVLVGLLVMDWASSMLLGGPIQESFPDVSLRLLLAYGVLTTLLSVGMLAASGWLFGSTLIRVFNGPVVIRSVRCAIALILFTAVFFNSIFPTLMEDMGTVSSIHRIMYEITKTPEYKDKMLEHLLCTRIPTLTRKNRTYITKEAAEVILDAKYNEIIPAATIQQYNEWIKDKKCPAGSEVGTNNPYPQMI